jgi:glycosyltransferase involved in cell wall biosynthesis
MPHKPSGGNVQPRRLRSLYIAYASVTDGLIQTQAIAYLADLVAQGHVIHLLSFEEEMTIAQKRQWRKRLKQQGIIWHSLRYHKRPTVPATAFDVLAGTAVGLRLIKRYHLQAVHARSHVAVAMGIMLKRLLGTKLIFDIRGLAAEEHADAGNWQRDGMAYKVTNAGEKAGVNNADANVVVTPKMREVLFGDQMPLDGQEGRPFVQLIPGCADVTRIVAQGERRNEMRAQLGLEDKTVLVYVGKIGSWYMHSEMADFFAIAKEEIPNLHFLVLTQSDHELMKAEFERHGIKSQDYTLAASPAHEVGAYLAAADFAIYFIIPLPSKKSAFPVKLGEYWAAGLPVVCNPGVGNADEILADYQAGLSVLEFNDTAYRQAAQQIQVLLQDPEVHERCRQAALDNVSLENVGFPRYRTLYEYVAGL